MRTADRETASQTALRNCSKEVAGKVRVICDFSEGGWGGRAVKHAFWQRLVAGHEEQMSPSMTLVLF